MSQAAHTSAAAGTMFAEGAPDSFVNKSELEKLLSVGAEELGDLARQILIDHMQQR